MSNEHTKPEATDGDRELALLRAITSAPANVNVTENAIRQIRAHVAQRVAEAVAAQATKDEAAHLQTIDERDAAEETLSQAFYLITGRSPEWSNHFGHAEALEEINDAQTILRLSLKNAESERDALAALVVRLKDELMVLQNYVEGAPVIVQKVKEIGALVPADLADKRLVDAEAYEISKKDCELTGKRNAALEADNRALREALEGLLDEQNGVAGHMKFVENRACT